MKSISSVTGKLTVLNRLPSSHFGNPRYEVLIDNQTVATMVDASLGYGITNFDGKEVAAVIGTHYGRRSVQSVELATGQTT